LRKFQFDSTKIVCQAAALTRVSLVGVCCALAGLEFKPKLAPENLLQTEAEFLIFGRASQFPFVQALTDLRKGGVVFELVGTEVVSHVLLGMDTFWEFINQIVASVPACCGQGGERGAFARVSAKKRFPDTLGQGEFKRARLKLPATAMRDVAAVWGALARVAEGNGDVADLRDLVGFPELEYDSDVRMEAGTGGWTGGFGGGVAVVPSYIA
jgi:hypothetical protein